MMKKEQRLCFGIMVNNLMMEEWKINCINKILNIKNIELSCIILDQTEHEHVLSKGILFTLYHRLCSKFLKKLKQFHIEIEYKGIPIHIVKQKYSERDIEIVEQHQLDFILNFNHHLIEAKIMDIPKYGIWSFHYGDEQSYFSESHCFWQIYKSESVSSATLYMCQNKIEQKKILKEGYFSTIQESFIKNMDQIYSSIIDWPALICKAILTNNVDHLRQESISYVQKECTPNSLQVFIFLYKLLVNKFKRMLIKLFCYEFWNVGIVNTSIERFLNDSEPKIEWLIKEKDLYYADPFGYVNDEGINILTEELDYKVINRYISKMNMNIQSENKVSIDQSIITLPTHMSYPYILKDENNIYCIPEISEEMEVPIYKLSETTNQWEKYKTILKNFAAVDSTIFKYGEFWWMFCTRGMSHSQSHNSELHIYYSQDLFGEWKPHQQNPVKIDVRSSRPAGTPFFYEDVLYRPAQDCSKTYGGRIVFNKIKTLSTSTFIEEPISYIYPQKDGLYPDGVHKVSAVGNHITLIDGKRFGYSIFHFFKKLYKYKRSRRQATDSYSMMSILKRRNVTVK